MALVSMKQMLADAKKNKYAVGCFNAINLEMARGVIQAAEQENSPVILCHAEVHFKYVPLDKIAPILINEAKNAKVPVAVLLDHGKSFSAVIKAMNLGFNAVMYDGSKYDFKQNVENTGEIVKIAGELGVDVEAELGYVVRPKSGGAEGDDDDSIIDDTSLYTKPEEACEFVEKTGVDALAIAFGTAHGVYLKTPQLDFERLKKISKAVDVPLVMHGGSGLTSQDFKKAIECGISKINYYTGMAYNASEAIREKFSQSSDKVYYHNIMMWSMDAFKDDVRKVIRLFGSTNKA
ncbi:MAG: class II fructose-bisphosphate aldolase [Clostridia bacterium]|nr:class II fructose-bisphosphate aldolase [Clostridia bacterium]